MAIDRAPGGPSDPRDPNDITEQFKATKQEVTSRNPAFEGPTRPEGNPADRPGWSDRGDMASQQASANRYNAWLNKDLQRGDTSARDALNKHIEETRNSGPADPDAARNALREHFRDAGREVTDRELTPPTGRGPDRDI